MATLHSRSIGAIPVTIITDEDHNSELNITQNPVEFGADITDHAYVLPKTVNLRGFIASGQSGFVGGTITSAAYQSLIAYQATRIPFTLITGLNFYKNMLIQSISAPRNVDNTGVLEFNVVCQQVLIVGTGFEASIIGAIAGGQAASLAAATLAVGRTMLKASPTVNRGDNVVIDVSIDATTFEGRRNLTAMARVGL